MIELLTYLLEASICLTVALIFYKVMLSDLTFFDLNRLILLTLLGAALVFPLLSFDLIPNQTIFKEVTLPTFWVGQGMENESAGMEITWVTVVFGIYLMGVIWTAVRLIFGFMQSFRLLGKSNLFFYQDKYIAEHPEFTPASFFQYILLPKFHLDDEDQQRIILHESVHVNKKHSWDLLFVQMAKVLFWFNPLIYAYENSIREVHEFQADQGVTHSFSQREYSRLLLKLVSAGRGWQFMNNFNQFQTKKRIIMMNKTKSNRSQLVRFLMAIPVLGLMFVAFSCDLTNSEEEIEGPTQVEKSTAIGPSNMAARIADVGADGKEIFDVTEVQPKPPGGMEGWNAYLAANLKYPEQARKLGVEGTVIAVFVVNSDGKISDVEILRGIGAGADEEAMRVIRNSPDWTPATQRGTKVNSRLRLPIRFKLG
ncbi:M56 family metallopeptidase [Algoriphagus machipongonensis]|uniref:TonB protein n=1 Tax=Algoriphagus machipongonensis TaxID=388413 RepID=A3I2W8_9BACT|nr:M56 family metallopeptidase [Algoriphagus machipongonensis]EAZ79167.1 TonB protein [Algoriphagus machipongonensis]